MKKSKFGWKNFILTWNFFWIFFGVLLTLDLCQTLDLGYNVIEQTGKFCPGRDSCRSGRSNRGPQGVENDWKKRNCFCDNACAVYGDCCIDAKAYVQAEQQVNHLTFECANLKQYGDIYMKKKCASNWIDNIASAGQDSINQPKSIRSACENPGAASDHDPFGATPVTSLNSGFTYKNYFCAVCNDDSIDVQFWRPRLECPTLTSYSNRFHNLTKKFIEDSLIMNEVGRWGINIDTSGVKVFHECNIDPAVPDALNHLIRSCSGKSTVDSCPENYIKQKDNNQTIAELCGSYTAMVFEPNAAYRNVHCAICNNASLEKLICLNLGPFGRFNWQQNFNSFSFAVLFDISGNGNDQVGFVSCQSGELYDPFYKKCRNVICGQEGMEYRQGRCISTRVIFPTTTTSTTTTSAVKSSTIGTTKPDSTTRFAFTVTTTVSPIITTTATTTEEIITTTISSSAATTTENNIFETTFTTVSTPIDDPIEYFTKEASISNTDEKKISSTEYNKIIDDDQNTNPNEDNNELIRPPPSSPISTQEFQDCPKFELQTGEFEMDQEKHSVYVEKYDKHYEEGDFSMKGDTLVICVTQDFDDYNLVQAKFGPQMGYVTFVCLGISIICLSLHIIASFLTSELQNLSGKNLLSLSIGLLGGYVTFVAAQFSQNMANTSYCKILATGMYFSFMASFTWMMIISFDVARTLKLATTQLRLQAGSQWRKFALYSTLGWGLPLAFTTVVTVIDQSPEDSIPFQYRPGFGTTDLCWFANKMALLVYFAVPFAGVMGVNIFLFLYSAHLVSDTTKGVTSKMTSTCGGGYPRTNFFLYLRLAIIMGLTWIVGLVAGFVNLTPMWYAFVALNTLQGLVIFLAFTCTRKVWVGVKGTLCGLHNSHDLGGNNTSQNGGHAGSSSSSGRNSHHNNKWARDISAVSASQGTKKSHLDLSSPGGSIGSSSQDVSPGGVPGGAHPSPSAAINIPSRYGPRSTTMYTVSKQQATSLTQHSFDGRYY